MGILKKTDAAKDTANVKDEAKQTPQFEGQEDANVAVETNAKPGADVQDVEHTETKVVREQPAPEVKAEDKQPEQPAVEAAEKADAPKQTAIVKRDEAGKLPTIFSSKKSVPNPLAELKGAFEANGIDVGYSTFPRLRVDAGLIATPEGEEAGNWIELQVLSYGPSWTVATGTDDEDSKKYVRFSKDGNLIDAVDGDEFEGLTCKEYAAKLKELGFEKASVKEYLQMYGIAVDAEEKDFKHMNEMVGLQLAPQSREKFSAYVLSRGIRARMGKVQETSGNPVVRFTTERVKGKERSYFNIIASDGLTAPVDLS